MPDEKDHANSTAGLFLLFLGGVLFGRAAFFWIVLYGLYTVYVLVHKPEPIKTPARRPWETE